MDFYGHSHLIAIKAPYGYFCYHWPFSPNRSVVLFTDAKVAKEWIKKVNTAGRMHWNIEGVPTMVRTHPEGFKVTINPSSDISDLMRIMSHHFYENW